MLTNSYLSGFFYGKIYQGKLKNLCVPGLNCYSCPDALVAILSDFILALQEVDVAVVFSHREDGIKFSVRSENPEVHAGELVRDALKGMVMAAVMRK